MTILQTILNITPSDFAEVFFLWQKTRCLNCCHCLSLLLLKKIKKWNVSLAFCCTDAEEDHNRGSFGRPVYSWAGRPETPRLGETKRTRAQCDREDNATVCLTEEGSVVVLMRADVRFAVVSIPGTSVGAADEGAQAGSEAEEGAGAAVQPAAHRVQPHAFWDADAGHTSSQVPATQSHGERQDWVLDIKPSIRIDVTTRIWKLLEWQCLCHESSWIV